MNLFTCKVALASGGVSTNIPIPGDKFLVAKELAASFLDSNSPAVSTEIELVALFLTYCSSRNPDVAVAVFLHLHQGFCADENIHVVVQQLSLSFEQACTVLKGYYSVWKILEARQLLPDVPVPAIFSDANIKLAAMFGSPGGADSHLDEAAWLLDVYGPLLSDFVTHMSGFLKRESANPLLAKAHSRPLDIAGWLASPDAMPDAKYLLTAPVITPVLGLIQAMHVVVLYKTLHVNPGDLVSRFKVAIGHSQGLTMAAAFASVTDEASFYAVTEKVLGILLEMSAIAQLNFSPNTSHAGTLGSSLDADSLPVPMVSVRGLTQAMLESFITAFNGDCTDERSMVSLALVNGRSNFVVSGKPNTIAYFAKYISMRTVLPTEDQSRIRFSQRKPVAVVIPLSMTMPTHCDLQRASARKVYEFATAKEWILNADTLRIPVNSGVDGLDLRSNADLTEFLIYSMCVYCVNWPAAVNSTDATHIIDFSPGRFSTFGQFARDIVDGYGKTVVSASSLIADAKLRMGSKADLFKRNISNVFSAPNWQSAFGPQLVRTAHDGQLHIRTRMSLTLGLPPVMVAGMTPTTSNEHFVAAISNAGYHVELAGGGMFNEKVFREKVDILVQILEPGSGFAVNTIYMDQRQWAFQYPSILRMRREGVPITGLCIGGGVPSVDVANSIIADLHDAGISHVAFKPGSVATIRQAIAIAKANSDFPVIIQWTGGRAGGHHSCEDFHEPILETYSEIRSLPNTVLVVGSGFGDASSIIPYITGQWSVPFGHAPMPVDGVLLASCVMTAKESAISLEAKELIAAATGVDDSDWEASYTGTAGGVITTLSGFGEPVHLAATRAALVLRELNDMIFAKPYADQLPIIMANKDRIIKWLNEDFTRPWFGKKSDGRVVDLEEMTYLEVLNRLVELLYVADKSKWLDASYGKLFGEFVSRVEDRVSKTEVVRAFQWTSQLLDPIEVIHLLDEIYPEISCTHIALEDVQYLIWLCKRSGTKPVPFVPVVDSDLHVWITKDTSSQYGDLDTVVDGDVQRTIICLGPVSAKYVTTVNEPVKDILDRVYIGVMENLGKHRSDRNASLLRTVEYLVAEPSPVLLPSVVTRVVGESSCRYTLPTDAALLPDHDAWLGALAGPTQSWLRALLTSPVVTRKSLYAVNPIRQVLRPMAGQAAKVSFDGNKVVKLDIYGSTGLLDVCMQFDGKTDILVTIYHRVSERRFEIQFPFFYMPSKPAVLIAEDVEARDLSYRNVFLDMYGIAAEPGGISVSLEPQSSDAALKSFTVTEEFVRRYCSSIQSTSEYYSGAIDGHHLAPMDVFFSIIFEQFLSLMSTAPLYRGQMGNLHLYHNIEYVLGASPLRVGDTIDYQITLAGRENMDVGQKATFISRFYRNGVLIATSEDAIATRNQYALYSDMFRSVDEPVQRMKIISEECARVLDTKEWFAYRELPEPFKVVPGDILEFRLRSQYQFKSKDIFSRIRTAGPVYRLQAYGEAEHIADIYFESTDSYGNPVIQYLNENQISDTGVVHFEHGGLPILSNENSDGLSLKAPSDNWEFAHASGDHNMIHTNPYVSGYIGESKTICHGMWTSAATRAVVERAVADNDPRRMRSFNVQFAGKVHPNDELVVELVHSGMQNGYMHIEGKTVNQNGETVLTFTTEIAQAKTAYVFTGQGSQFAGMGMDLYKSSSAARDVWDRAEEHMLKKYGVSLLKIVRDNPTEYLVKFGGKKGTPIRTNYLSLVRKFDGRIEQLISGITQSSQSYTHRCANGLLNATLFTQPIQTVMSLAQAADMRAHGLIQDDAIFTGHSLGEFGSLAAIAEIVSVEDAVDIALYRGLLLHASVGRDANGCSEYAMVSVNPKRVAPGFSEVQLLLIVDYIRERKQQLLEVINYNVRGQQYIVTGHVESLDTMRLVTDELSARRLSSAELEDGHSLQDIIDGILSAHPFVQPLRNGRATIVIPGIDVPSHSSQMLTSVDTFRNLLDQRIPHTQRLHTLLCGKYIPNVCGLPLETTKQYFEHVYAITRSPVIGNVLQCWDTDGDDLLTNKVPLTRTLLIELLAYQFAASVKWIEAQDSMFKKCSVRRFVEIGPRPILCRMATQTLAASSWLREEVAILHACKNRDDIYYSGVLEEEKAVEHTDTLSPESTQSSSALPSIPEKPVEYQIPAMEELPAPHPIHPAAVSSVDDVPIPIIDILKIIVAPKLSKTISEIVITKSIKELVAGKSMLQNELLGDFQKEFGTKLPDYAEDQPLEELAKKLGDCTNSLGKQSQSLINKMFVSKFPSGFKQSVARLHLKESYGLGPRRQDVLLLMSVTVEPPARLSDEQAAHVWLESAAQLYARHAGLSLTAARSGSNTNNSSAASVVINSVEFDKAQSAQRKLILEQMETLAKHAGVDMRHDARSAEKHRLKSETIMSEIDEITHEVGREYIAKTKMLFDSNKARRYDSYWNWARQDLFEWISGILSGKEPTMDQSAYMKRIHMLKNRSNPGLLLMLNAFIETLKADSSPLGHRALKQAEIIYAECKESEKSAPVYKELSTPLRPHTEVTFRGDIVSSDVPRDDEHSIRDYIQNMKRTDKEGLPLLYMYDRRAGITWSYSKELSEEYFCSMEDAAVNGISFEGKYALVTGCGKGSIGSGLVEGLLSGGAKVIATTSNYTLESVRFFEEMYRTFGSRGSELVLVPFNQASAGDIEGLIQYIYSEDGLGWDLDYIAPFAAFPEHGKDAASADSYSELTLRTFLTNLFRIIGQVKAGKLRTGNTLHPSLLILPHSPNHGVVGNDGMYGETKLALHTLYNRWHTESWSEYISITGGEIGWTRSTNMTYGSANVYASIEEMGLRTFSREEMSFNILSLLTPRMELIAHDSPVCGNFNGGTISIDGFGAELARRRSDITSAANVKKAVSSDLSASYLVEAKHDPLYITRTSKTVPRAQHRIDSPTVKSYDQLEHLRHLEGMVDLDKVVVVVGFGEVGTFGNGALRWEQEAHGAFSTEGCIELAWMMGLIKRFSGEHPGTGSYYIGWVDAKTQEPVHDMDIRAKYEPYILEHTGIRTIEPHVWGNDAVNMMPYIRELQIEQDMLPFETTADEAVHFKHANGDKVDTWENPDGTWSVRFLKGAVIHVPKSTEFGNTVVAQLPTGWDPVRLGIPKSIAENMDQVNHYTLVAAMEALLRSGITDPYELYQYFHVSKVGHAVGSCVGGAKSFLDMMRNRYLDKTVSSDAIVESSINNISAWLNVVLFSASGPLRPCIGACATSAVALDLAAESIIQGNADVMITGAGEDFNHELSYGLSSSKATINAKDELAKGRVPQEMSRPCTSSRSGFAESYGSGIAVLMSASAALKFGAPIYGIVAMTATASDKSTRNSSAPGQGILSTVKGHLTPSDLQLLDIHYRRRMRDEQLAALEQLGDNDRARKLKKVAKTTWGNDFYKMGQSISPLRAALATWGLNADDIGLSAFHGTSTRLNDRNESHIVSLLMKQAGRTPGLPVPVACQKWILGHKKGGSAICSIHGILQSMATGLIPGNRNADNIDGEFEQHEYLVYPSKTIQVPTIKAALHTSFGFSQSNGAALIVHPDYLLATLSKDELHEYKVKVDKRMKKSTRYLQGALLGNHTYLQAKEAAPFTPEQEVSVFLDTNARAKLDPETKQYTF